MTRGPGSSRPGTGVRGTSIYQRSSDGLWLAAVTISVKPRRRRTFAASTREEVEAKLAAALAAGVKPVSPRPEDGLSRQERERKARAKGGAHTAEEWRELCGRTPNCPHCGVQLTIFNRVADHIVPLVRGGSDAIGNVMPVCWRCNTEKGILPAGVFRYDGPRPRPFEPMPTMVDAWARFCVRRDVLLGRL